MNLQGFAHLAVCFLLVIHEARGIFNVYPKARSTPLDGDPGEPLFLTPLLQAGKFKEARDKALVPPLKGAEGVVSYSGYFTVEKTFNSNMFFWFFPAEVKNVET